MTARARTKLDMGRLAATLGKFAQDARQWCVLAQVEDVGFDAEQGVFADVTYLDSGVQDTVLVGAAYAGDSFGLWLPLSAGDVVLVALPNGEGGGSAVLAARLWSAARTPPTEAQSTDDPETTTEDVVLRVRAGRKLRLLVDGEGSVEVRARGTGEVRVAAADGRVVVESTGAKVYLGGDAGTFPVALAPNLSQWMTDVSAWLAAHTHSVAGVTAGPATVAAAPSVPGPPAVPAVAAQKVEAK